MDIRLMYAKGKQRCRRCSNDTIKCCYYGVNHTAAYGGCTVRKQAVEQVKSEGKVIHAGTVRIYNNERREERVNQASLKQVQDQDRNITTTQEYQRTNYF